MRLILLFLPLLLMAQAPHPWLVYYNNEAPLSAFTPYDPIILQPAFHPALGPLLNQGKGLLGYVNAGEVSLEDSWFLEAKNKGLLLGENQNFPGSFAVDIRKEAWEELLLGTVIPHILDQGFTGIFLDQLDVALNLGMEEAAEHLIKKIREKFPKISIMLNRAYKILPKVGHLIDYELAETLYTSYDFKEKRYFIRPNDEFEWQLKEIDAARKKFPELLFFSLDYWNLKDQKMIEKIYKKEIAVGMRPYVSDILLNQIVAPPKAKTNILPRHILAFWDSKVDLQLENSLAHKFLEMPLNHLGFDLIYVDIHDSLPNLAQYNDLCGILICFQEETKMQKPETFIDWAVAAIELGKKVVLMSNPGFLADLEGLYTPEDVQNRLYERIGFINTQRFINYPFDYTIAFHDSLTPFERNYPDPLPGFYVTKLSDPDAVSHLSLAVEGKIESHADLIITTPHGGYVSQYYANNYDPMLYMTNPRVLGWYLDPFRFFEKIFIQKSVPIPDTTTLAGRRIFYATCHGDNWNGGTAIEEYRDQNKYCSELILEKIIQPYPDIPTAVGIIAATVDPTWVARKKSQEIARAYNALPQVEATSHTYSHPFDWEFFKGGDPKKEINYLGLYPDGSWQNSYLSWFRAKTKIKGYAESPLEWGFVIPRAYAKKPFDLPLEIGGAVHYLNQFTPPNNQVNLLLWPGDGRPWETPLALCYQAAIKQLGGGFVRFDPEYPSHLFVFPLGRKPGGWIQPYASCSAENSYTNGWSDRFYGYKYLPATLQNTESPRRLKPIQLYYHSYSGEYLASINAIIQNIDYIRTQNYIPIKTSRFCTIVEGFYSTQIEMIGPMCWKIHERGGLQTIRFDHAEKADIDLAESIGVIGWTRHEGSLYVYLDKAEKTPLLALGAEVRDLPYLIDSSWEIWNVKREGASVTFTAQGFGKLQMRWKIGGAIKEFLMDLPSNQEVTMRVE